MSIISSILWCYPRISPISKSFIVASNIHAGTGPKPPTKAGGFDMVLVDGLKAVSKGWELYDAIAASTDLPWITGIDPDFAWTKTLLQRYGKRIWGVVAVNEPNSPRFWTQGVTGYVGYMASVRTIVPPDIRLIGGNLATISSCDWKGWIKSMGQLGLGKIIDIFGIHAYASNGRTTYDQFEKVLDAYRSAGFTHDYFVTEFGFQASDEKQARWTTYLLSKLAKTPHCLGASVYEYNNDSAWSMTEFGTQRQRPVIARIAEARV